MQPLTRPLVLLVSCLWIAGGIGLPTSARAQAIAQNDSIDFGAMLEGAKSVPLCSCFCTYEGFGATLTAPEDMSINYLYVLYGAFGFTETIFDFHLWQGAEAGENYFTFPSSEGEQDAIGYFVPLAINASQIVEINVSQSGVQPPQVLEGEQFSVGFHYNYDPDFGELPLMEPGDGHGPTYDQDGEASSGTNWILGLDGGTGDCGAISDSYSWKTMASLGFDFDWVIRASEQPIDWSNVDPGDDDDDDDDDDAADDDDDAADDDDDDGAQDLVVLSITPSFMEDGESVQLSVIGQGFDDSAQVFIGGLAASDVSFVSAERVDARSPQALPVAETPYDVLVSLSDGQSSTLPGAFEVRDAGAGCACSSAASGSSWTPALLLVLLGGGLLRRRR